MTDEPSFVLAADWRMQDGFEENIKRLTTGPGPETGQVLTARAPAAHASRPEPGVSRAFLGSLNP
jgi:hypothetical protein